MNLARRERILLLVLAALLLVFGARALFRWASGGDLGLSLGGSSVSGLLASRDLDVEVQELRLGDLERLTPKLELGRDPFRFAAQAPRPRKPRPKPKKTAPAPPPPPPRGPRPPPFTLDFIGSFGPGSRQIAVFSDGEVIHNAMLGEILEDKFIVHRIGYESVDIRFVGFPDVPPERLAVGG